MNRRVLDYDWEYGTEKIMIHVGKFEFENHKIMSDYCSP